jgi:hypothetical protein
MESDFFLDSSIGKLSIEDILLEDRHSKELPTAERILEELLKAEAKHAVFNPDKEKSIEELEQQDILLNAPGDKKLLLYKIDEDRYFVYWRHDEGDDEQKKKKRQSDYGGDKDYGLYIPTGVVVQRVPQNILGNGVLGRAFIGQNYIEILDSLVGDAYMEVLTHEVFHIQYPEKREMEIRHMTRNYIGDRAIYH